ncbi:MAG: hypothetical protein ACE5IZ_11740, partial [Dehalococcoidia bacterium]
GLTMSTRTTPTFRLRACQRCGGDAYLNVTDEPEWRCLQCGRLVPAQATPVRLTASATGQQVA